MNHRERNALNSIHWLVRAALGAGLAFGVGACGVDPGLPPAALGGSGGAGSQTAVPSAGATGVAAGSGAFAGGYASLPVAGASGSGAGAAGSAGVTAPVMRATRFDAGADPDRNKVSASDLCTRLATINCAGEAYCCETPTRTVTMCQVELTNTCKNELYLDQVAANPSTGFDKDAAERAYTQLEQKAASCDPSAAAWGSSFDGLRGILKGTLAPNSDCSPQSLSDAATLAAALVSCSDPAHYACASSSVLGPWSCAPKAAVGGTCNTDNNCGDDAFCAISVIGSTGTCTQRKPVGADCAGPTECVSLFCKDSKCVPATQQAAYCLQN